MASIFPTGLTYSRNTKDPLQSKIVWDSLSEARIYVNNPDETAYVGMTLAVVNDSDAKNNGLWYVEAIGTKASPTAGVLKKVGSNEVLTAANYTEAKTFANAAPVGTLIKVIAAEGEPGDDNFHAAGFYIVSVNGADPSILMLSTTSGEDMDLDAVITALSDLQKTVATKADADDVYDKLTADATFVKDVQGQNVSIDRATGIVTVDMSGKVDSSVYDKFVQDTNDALNAKLESSDLADYAKTADVVSATTYATDKQATDSAISALETKVGNKAEGETVATGLFKDIEDLRADITAIPKFDILPVDELPSEGSESTVYLVKDKESDGDLYTEYIFVNGAWENLGKQTVDLSGYSTTTEMNLAINSAIEDKIAGYYTKDEVDAALADKADTSELSKYVETTTLTADYFTKTEVETELGKKADATALSNYVENTTLTTELAKKADTSALDAYVKLSDYETDKQTLQSEINKKADATVLDDYLKIADIDANLTEYVKQEALNTKLNDYVTTTALNTTLGDYVLASALNESSSLSVKDGVYEVNAISDVELNEIITSSSNVTE